MTNSGSDLAAAYARQTEQLHDARTALADAVVGLKTELNKLHVEHDQAWFENRDLRVHIAELEAQIRDLLDEIAALRNMKVVRWTTQPRRMVHRWRARRR